MAKKKSINFEKLPKRFNIDDVIKEDNPIIRKVSEDVLWPLSKDNVTLMHQMMDYVISSQKNNIAEKRNLRPAVGIAAIQLGQPVKMTYIRIPDKYNRFVEEFALLNPKIIWKSKELAFLNEGEGCLSIPENKKGYVYRNHKIKVEAIDYMTEREIIIDAEGYTAIVLQHEIEHMYGILYCDKINRLNPMKKIDGSIKI